MLAGWLVSAWQISLGFTLGLQYAYLLAVLALLVLWYWWRGRLTRARVADAARLESRRTTEPRPRLTTGAGRLPRSADR